ncbi:MAG: hypothetical protein F6K24_23660 [Okeania sp. SIO2D1]|nr:hypothetical protein [Okeania sp. SIO2D1]
MLYLSEFSVVNSAVGMILPIFLAQETITPPAEIDPAMVDGFMTAINLA